MNKRTCTIEGCEGAHDSRGLCKRHASQAARARGEHLKPTPCSVCGAVVMKAKREPGRRPVCSEACRTHLTYGTWPTSPWKPPPPAVSVLPKRHPAVQIAAQRSPRVFVSGSCANCGETFTAYSEGGVAVVCSTSCARRLIGGSQRVDRTKRIDHVTWRSLMAEGLTDCQLCDEPVDLDDQWWTTGKDGRPAFCTGPSFPSVDHIVPVSHGGEHSRANAQLAHKGCNEAKGDGIRYSA